MGSLAGLFALGIFTRRTHGVGALVGAAVGAAILYCVQQYTDFCVVAYAGVGVIGCFAGGYLASLILPAPPKDLHGLTLFTQQAPTT